MKTRNPPRATRLAPAHAGRREEPALLVLEQMEDAPCSEYIVMSQAREMPALQEYLLECARRTLH